MTETMSGSEELSADTKHRVVKDWIREEDEIWMN